MSSNGTPPLIFIEGIHGAYGRGLQLYPLEATLGASEELPHIKVEAVGPMGLVGRPWWSAGLLGAPTAPKFGNWAIQVSLVVIPWGMACPMLVFLGIWACFDPFQPESHALIGCTFCLELRSVFPCT